MKKPKNPLLANLPKLSNITVAQYCQETGLSKEEFYKIYRRSGKVTPERLEHLDKILSIESKWIKKQTEDNNQIATSISKHIALIKKI